MKKINTIITGVVFMALTAHTAAAQETVAQAQSFLTLLGYNVGPVDGAWGGKTERALVKMLEDNGQSFDGELSENEFDILYDALKELPFNGADMSSMLSAQDGITSYTPEYDFIPSVDLTEGFPLVETIVPFGLVAEKIRNNLELNEANYSCGWILGFEFSTPALAVVSYSSAREGNTSGNQKPNGKNGWLDDLSFGVSRAAAHIAATQNDSVIQILKATLLEHATFGTALDSSGLLAPGTNTVIFTPDFGSAVLASTAITLNYLLVKEQLDYSNDERAIVEEWLNRLFETYADSYFEINGHGSNRDPRAFSIISRAYMASGMLNNGVEKFNTGAQFAALFISFTREDGSHRFGASRGNRALWYQGAVVSNALESLLIMESQGLPAREILLPTIERAADFLEKGWQGDHSAFWPYSPEDNGTFAGSDYRVQDILDVTLGLDLFFAVSPNHPSVPALREVRATYPYPSIYTESFNATCLAVALR